ncbi:MAG: hypothetical protein ABUS49_03990, partial [Acidobacteriota bacterium]
MNRPLAVFALTAMLTQAATIPVPGWLDRRFHPESVQVRDVEGIHERISEGKLNLTLRDFLELVLRNSTDIHISRLDVYTAADQIRFAKAVFDPALSTGFTAVRSVSPQFSQIGGASTLSSLSQVSNINFQQLLPTGETASIGFNASRNSTNSAF